VTDNSGAAALTAYLASRQVEATLVRSEQDMPTVDRAAAALGVPAAAIVKSIVFEHKQDSTRVCLAIVPGDARVSRSKVADALGVRQLRLASADTVARVTGYPPGGVPPVGHRTPVPVVLDSRVLGHDVVFGGGGDEWHMLRISPGDIQRLTAAIVADVTDPLIPHPSTRNPDPESTIPDPGSRAGETGRLSRPPHPVLFELLYEPQMARAQQDVLPYLLAIDAAHVVMLAECGLLTHDAATALLRVNGALADRLERGANVLDTPPAHRGVYFVYEREYITRLGDAVGGAAHLARSRNDINATIVRMRLRDTLAGTLDRCADLVAAIGAVAAAHVETAMSGFTHLQPAQPTTLGHYLAGLGFELLRAIELLDHASDAVNRSPMGAAAGYGTSFAIDRDRVADLLGFAAVVENSLDAVASRDYVVQVLHAVAALGITMTRLATDLQAWSSVAYGFIGWPDDLVSTSSIMPQKRNAFVLEQIRGQAAQAVGALVSALVGMKNVPFANSVEVSAEATSHVWPALAAADRATRLMRLLLQHVEVFPDRAREFAAAADTGMTAAADMLVAEHGLAFRTAHDVVGRALRDGASGATFEVLRSLLEKHLAEATGGPCAITASALARALDPAACVFEAAYGGGPAPASVRAQLDLIAARREALQDRSDARRRALASAVARRRSAAGAIGDVREAGRDGSSGVCD
jgi:argininosuccinate lyase